MVNSEKIRFEAKILPVEKMDAAYIEFPFDVQTLFGTKGQVKVKVKFDGIAEYRGSLANMGMGRHILPLTKEIRKQIGKTFSDMVFVELERDVEDREVSVPPDVQIVLNENPVAFDFFWSLAYTHRKEYIRWITDAKKEETRLRRIDAFLEKLLAKKKPDQK